MRRILGRHLLAATVVVVVGATLLLLGILTALPASGQIGFWSDGPSRRSRPLRSGYLADGKVHSFYFTRGAYSSWGRSWATDYPKADRQFLTVLRRLTGIDASPYENAVALDDPELRRFPFLYMLEVGGMRLTEAEAKGLRTYLLAGGFLAIDDFWGPREWRVFEQEIERVLPEYDIVELSLEHEIFRTFYDIDDVLQVPNLQNARRGGATWEKGGRVPHVRGIFDDEGRLMVIINFNTDLGDAWEWAEQPDYPLVYSTYAYEMGANFLIYSMTR